MGGKTFVNCNWYFQLNSLNRKYSSQRWPLLNRMNITRCTFAGFRDTLRRFIVSWCVSETNKRPACMTKMVVKKNWHLWWIEEREIYVHRSHRQFASLDVKEETRTDDTFSPLDSSPIRVWSYLNVINVNYLTRRTPNHFHVTFHLGYLDRRWLMHCNFIVRNNYAITDYVVKHFTIEFCSTSFHTIFSYNYNCLQGI